MKANLHVQPKIGFTGKNLIYKKRTEQIKTDKLVWNVFQENEELVSISSSLSSRFSM